jgi:hypothetical protein
VYREVDPVHRRHAVIIEARRIRDALEARSRFYNIGQIGSSQEIIDALTACLQELS